LIDNKSIAILPFLNLSADPENEYFSDGITEDIINALSRIDGLKVSARTSSFAFKGRQMDVRHIGNQLGVSSVLEGSVRRSKNRVRISAQLVQTTDGFQIWSGRFDRDFKDIFELQDDISLEIAEQIRENFGHFEIGDRLVDAPTDNVEAYNLYLKARYNHLRWDQEGIENAIRYYGQCMEMAPDFSWPYFGAGFCHAMFGSWTPNVDSLKLADQYINKGFQLDAESFLGYYSKATLSFWGHWDYQEGRELYKKSIALNPSFTEAEEGLAELYTAIGWFDEAMKHTKHILQLDPLSPNHHFTKGNIHFLQKEYDSALACAETALHINSSFTHAVILKQLSLIKLNDEDALSAFINSTAPIESGESCQMLYELVNQPSDEPVTAREIEEVLNSDPGSLVPWSLYLYANSDMQDKALDDLRYAVENRRGQYANLLSNPFLEPIRQTQGYKELIEKNFHPSRFPRISVTEEAQLLSQNGEAAQPRVLMEEDEITVTINKLDRLMNQELRFLDTSLSLRLLADETDVHPNKLSWLLNDVVGMSFNDYVNHFRLELFKEKALDPENHNYTLLGLAFESGFNSKSTFNDYFKKKVGMSPRKWLKQQ
jgi:TolB-like protein/AraC-like DNA-binding protein